MKARGDVPTSNGFRFSSFDGYLFDIDGTLLNSRDLVHYNAFHQALLSVYGCGQKIDDVPVHGNTDVGILRAAVQRCETSDTDFERGLAKARALMGDAVEQNAHDLRPELCPGIRDLLGSLHAEGKRLGVCTGNFERIGWTKLRAAGIRDLFSTGSFSDEHELRPDIFRDGLEKMRQLLGSEARICFIGDTPNDISAAQALSIPVLAVATGIYRIEQLREFRPTHCVGCCLELL